MIRVVQPLCPACGDEPTYIVETLLCRAYVRKAETEGKSVLLEYEGDSDMFWDTQSPMVNDDGTVSLGCQSCGEWETRLIEEV